MTSQDALAGLSRLQLRFKPHRYKGSDLNPIWGELLRCRVEAFSQAVGIMEMHGKFLPRPDYLLALTRSMEKRMETGATLVGDAEDGEESVAKRSIRLTQGYLEGTLAPIEYVAEMYRLSDQTGRAEYAEAAQRVERRIDLGQGATL